jgi:hypothetical protein
MHTHIHTFHIHPYQLLRINTNLEDSVIHTQKEKENYFPGFPLFLSILNQMLSAPKLLHIMSRNAIPIPFLDLEFKP